MRMMQLLVVAILAFWAGTAIGPAVNTVWAQQSSVLQRFDTHRELVPALQPGQPVTLKESAAQASLPRAAQVNQSAIATTKRTDVAAAGRSAISANTLETVEECGAPPSTYAQRYNPQEKGCKCLLQRIRWIDGEFRANNATMPLINHALYSGQGFGRMMEHSLRHLVLAVALGRPLLIDLHRRDGAFTWRSFFEPGDINWAPPAWVRLELYANMIERVGSSNLNEQKLMGVPELFPVNGTNIERFRRPTDAKRVMYSANWGAWFNKIDLSRIHSHWGCSLEELAAHTTIFKPTSLSLHVWKKSRHQFFPRVPESQKYGAIHIRRELTRHWKVSPNGAKVGPNATDWAAKVEDCVRLYPDIKYWALLADDPEMAMEIAGLARHNMTKDQHITSGSSKDAIKVVHSNARIAKGLYGHMHMESSIRDWMLLRMADVTILSSGAFGASALYGTGKSRVSSCGQYKMTAFATRCPTGTYPNTKEKSRCAKKKFNI